MALKLPVVLLVLWCYPLAHLYIDLLDTVLNMQYVPSSSHVGNVQYKPESLVYYEISV